MARTSLVHALRRVCLVAVGIGVCAAPASAQPRRSALSWVREPGAETCIGAAELGRRVERLVGPVLVAASQAEVSIEARIARVTGGYQASIVVSSGAGQILGKRALSSADADCRAMDDQLAFVVAVAIDPDAALAELPGEFASGDDDPGAELLTNLRAHPPHHTELPPSRLRTRPASRSAPAIRRSPGRPLRLRGELMAAAALGVLPGPAFGPAAGVGAGFDGLLLWLHAGDWLSQEVALERGARVHISLWQLDLAACPRLWSRPGWELSACVGSVLAQLEARPVGFSGPSQRRWVVGPRLGGRLERQLWAGLWLVFALDGQGLWPRHRVTYASAGLQRQAAQSALLAGAVSFGLQMRF